MLSFNMLCLLTVGLTSAFDFLQPTVVNRDAISLPSKRDDSFIKFPSLKHYRARPRKPNVQPASKTEFPPWSCDCDMFWRDLGYGFLPRFVRDGRCVKRTCFNGHFRCQPRHYGVTVLKELSIEELATAEEVEYNGGRWAMAVVNVTTNCQCGEDFATR